jgi:hypothetical protein
MFRVTSCAALCGVVFLGSACGSSEADDDAAGGQAGVGASTGTGASNGSGGGDGAYFEATILMVEGDDRPFEEVPSLSMGAGITSCDSFDGESYGLAIAWDTLPSVGSHDLMGATTYPAMSVAWPISGGKVRYNFADNGTVTITKSGQGSLEGELDGFSLTVDPNDPDDLVEGVSAGSFRCVGDF